ncbi:7801_t:CDS:2, partial [Entrophospora sp. SA101]
MWHCMYKACPCVFPRKEYQTPFDNYYEDDDNVEFENLLADPDSIPARLSRSPFQRSNSQGYLRINSMVAPDEETSLPSGHFDTLLEDDEEDNIQTADAQFLPDEQINKISEQVKFNQFNQMTDEQLIAEEEEETRLQEEEYNKKRQAAKQAALAKGLMTSEQAVNHPFQRCSNYDRRSPDSLFKRRHSRRSLAMMNDGIQKVDISSSLSFNIPTTQQSFDYDATIEDYSPSLDEDIEEYQTPFDNYYEDDDNVEFENLLADPDSIPARLSRSPFQRSNSQGYLRINSMVAPDEETSLPSGHFDTLLEDDEEDNIQTADAQFLPDEQINKISEQVKFNQFNQMTDEQLIAEEEEETRLQEEEYNKKRQAAKQAALAKGLMTSEQAVNHPFQRCSNYDRRSPDSLFKRRHSRRSLAMMNDGIQKVDISSSLSFNIPTTQQSFDYDATIEDYSPSLDEDIEE